MAKTLHFAFLAIYGLNLIWALYLASQYGYVQYEAIPCLSIAVFGLLHLVWVLADLFDR